MQMGRGEELGSGVLNVNKYLPFYTKGAKPRFVEGDPFVTIIPLPSETGASERISEKTSEKPREKILNLLQQTPSLTTADLAVALGITVKGVAWQLNRLQQTGRLRRIGPDKGGHWEVAEDRKS
jgi:ATP-dependent DNA helicase RecG